MDHSVPLEEHTNLKLDKISEILDFNKNVSPFYVEIWLNAHKQHPHHSVELHLKAPMFDLNTKDEGTDMYVTVDSAIDKMITLIKKEKSKHKDKKQKTETNKKEFTDDKYTLGEE